MSGLRLKGPIKDDEFEIVPDGGLLIEDGLIREIGKFEELRSRNHSTPIHEIEYDAVCLPGLVDAHTHICWAGSRASDYARRNAGMSYLEIAKAGGGIWDTVTKTRAATSQELVDGIFSRANNHLERGITTIEVKSGYGLSVEHELKMLRAIQEANSLIPQSLISTCLAAHILPKDFKEKHQEYLNHLVDELLPILRKESLTNRIDIFVEEEAFDQQMAVNYLSKARQLGLDVTVHADQFHVGGSEVAVAVGAVSADHLEASTEKEIRLLAKSEVVATALPGASLGLGEPFTPARKLLDAGCALAIASDWNPGSAPMGDLLTQAAILGANQKLSNAEVLAGVTVRAAAALKLADRGRLTSGNRADLAIFPCSDVNEILYHQGQLKPSQVWIGGKMEFSVDN